MSITLGIPSEAFAGEARVAATPDTAKKAIALGVEVLVEAGAGSGAGYPDEKYSEVGARIVDGSEAFFADIVFKVQSPSEEEISRLKQGAVYIGFIDISSDRPTLESLTNANISAIALERIPRISRAQSMDALSSQAGITGYRSVIEAAYYYGRFFPLMMTSAGSAKPAKVTILGAGVAGLQAIATAKRLGAQVFAYDVRPQVKEEIHSLGAKFIELDLGESGEGEGGYAKELSEEAKKKQEHLLTEELKTADIIISTAQIPGRKAPILITEEAVRGMREGSVIIDLAAASGGNCPLTKEDEIIKAYGVTLCGLTNLPALMPGDASAFYSRNLYNLLELIVTQNDQGSAALDVLQDEITADALVTHEGVVRQALLPGN
ncbi:MAG: Re/Si-specific NAD(P)(+) transhydrogenase subunit alpha [Arenicellales bacterium]|jgi:NAD(P) transhydrogenase subunit alpha|nr:Re/Si-specific NAD(P)(+) transhydrogenase subunit alpha [Arenicellales bacterium]MDP6288748.1 Re/Si-specific NAD(P)(+) transhydrogenase subunit alpha [Arenicellales bacterium]MDP7155628.1 Re/Si-specific NAD(P)(+) transhydrogenase subunit alpha [Arenicellales bacterium]MDP7283771.1 Re/Si-specific NAD(P)(+) transhydrogenase subunit alpha [Arenicellales bacterium]MDP7481661.1 Re/Si-specific NAD(P)(+) transhydrogenase subunit alpha [Arenicellales bacterium]|tara:strand:+ start:247 stop:1380 length:1134 start_codon:yes stop_codon:yes gene_type:complete